MGLLNNITENYTNLQNDFLGISFNPEGIINYFINILITLGVFLLFYFVGEKIRNIFFKQNRELGLFINITLGYIVIATGIGLLGLLSILYKEVLFIYIFSLSIVALYPLRDISINPNIFKEKAKKFFTIHNKYILIGVMLFVFIAFLRLSVPDTTEDGYHTDLPSLYLLAHTSIHEPKDQLRVISYPQLAETIYTIPIALGHKDAVRFIHFGFYLLVILLLFKIAEKKEHSFTEYAPLFFVTAPLVIRYSSTQYTDFFMLLPFLLSITLLTRNALYRTYSLAGIFFGAVISVKMWMLVYLPIVILYIYALNRKESILQVIRKILIFSFSVFTVPALWYLRSFVIIGNPIYPIFAKLNYFDKTIVPESPDPSWYFALNTNMFTVENLIVYSPLFFLSILFIIFHFRVFISLIKKSAIYIFVLLFLLEQLVARISLGRYLIAWYTFSSIIVSAGAFVAITKHKVARYGFVVIYFIIFGYYMVNTLLILPYGFGWADTNKYLTRVLFRDNASYYDFDQRFNKHINNDDLVATYGFVSFYYANFNYKEVGYIFNDKERSFTELKDNNITKLLINGGDIHWFCDKFLIAGCTDDRVKLLAAFPSEVKKYYLYSIE